MHKPLVSVVVPVFNDLARLKGCLAALRRQSYAADLTEIIVVDNASTEDIRSLVAAFPGIIYAQQPVRGPAAARNQGVSLARGQVIAFTDADCLPAADWLERGVAALKANPRCGMLGGRVDMFFLDPHNPTAAELYDSATYLQQRKHVQKDHFAATANAFVPRTVWDAVGGFNQTFPTASGEDLEWGRRAHARGYEIAYADDAVVLHPAEPTLAGLCRKAVRIQRGLARVDELIGSRPSWPLRIKALGRPIYVPLVLCARVARANKRVGSLAAKAMVCLIVVCVYYWQWSAALIAPIAEPA